MNKPSQELLRQWQDRLSPLGREHLQQAVDRIVSVKKQGGRVLVATGSGPNIHEGVTTLIAELMHRGVIDGVLTSSAVVAHEMAGTLDRVHRVRVDQEPDMRLAKELLPRGGVFEVTRLTKDQIRQLQSEIDTDWDLYERILARPGDTIIKAAGNMAWPMGLRTEKLAREAEILAKQTGRFLEQVVGTGADPRTMIGAGARLGKPVVVSTPQLVGGGAVGLAIGDSVSLTQRSIQVAKMLAEADVIIESAIALSQEIHDGPFEVYTGHGIWSGWQGEFFFSLEGKTLIRFDLDSNLELAWQTERQSTHVQQAIDRGLPKTKMTGIPFRMEMSGFARLEGSLPVTGDIGVIWPLLASAIEQQLGIELDFRCFPQESLEGQKMRDWIADSIEPVDRSAMQRHTILETIAQEEGRQRGEIR